MQGTLTKGGRLSMIDFLIKIGCFVKRDIKFQYIKSSSAELLSTRRSTILILPFSKTSLVYAYSEGYYPIE